MAGLVVAAALCLSTLPASADIIAADARKPAPRWKLPNMTGGSKQLADYKGKVLLLNFWATWCVPCKQEIPWFAEFYDKYKTDGLEVVGISVDEKGWKVVKPYVDDKANGINYTILHDNVDLTVLYKIPADAEDGAHRLGRQGCRDSQRHRREGQLREGNQDRPRQTLAVS